MRFAAFAVSALALSGCIGQGDGGFTFANLTGRSFSGLAPTVLSTSSADGPVGNATLAVAFDEPGKARIQINNVVSDLSFNSSFGGYTDKNGRIGIRVGTGVVGAPPTPDILYLSVLDTTSSFADQAMFLVVGNNTPAAQLPSGGKASYTGRIFLLNGAGNSGLGDLSLAMNFPALELTGGFTAIYPTDDRNGIAASFRLVPAQVSGGSFRTGLTSSDVTLISSTISGGFFGTFGDQVGGTVLIRAVEGNAVGQFGAAD